MEWSQRGTLLLSLVYTATCFIKQFTKHWCWGLYSAIHDAGHMCSRWYTSDTHKAPLIFKLLSHSGPNACYPTQKKWVSTVCSHDVTASSCWNLLQITCQPGTSYGVQRDGNHWMWDQDCKEGGSKPPSHSVITNNMSGGRMGPRDFHLFGLLKKNKWLASDV